MSFVSLGISPSLNQILSKQGIAEPTPIQSQAIPIVLKGKDVLGVAKTGSGKTAAYVLPLLMNQAKHERSKNRFVDVLILVPTRELAQQVQDVILGLSAEIKSMAVYGGVSINPQMMNMNGVEWLIATPGRLLDLIEHNAVHLSEIHTLVLDEADKMLNQGFEAEMKRILALLPKKRQNLLFSATLSPEIEQLKQLVLNNAELIQIEEPEEAEVLIKQSAFLLSDEKKGPFLRYLIKQRDLKQVLIFVSSIQRADRVADKLSKNGVEAAAIHSDKSQHARTEALARFKKGKIRVLVATDLLGRGVDIEQLPVVINYELPRSPKDFIHRIGRTGRAGIEGEAITLLTHEDLHHFGVIQKKMGVEIEIDLADEIDLKGF